MDEVKGKNPGTPRLKPDRCFLGFSGANWKRSGNAFRPHISAAALAREFNANLAHPKTRMAPKFGGWEQPRLGKRGAPQGRTSRRPPIDFSSRPHASFTSNSYEMLRSVSVARGISSITWNFPLI